MGMWRRACLTLGEIRRRKEEIRKRNEIKVVSDVVYLGTQRRNGEERKGYMDSMEMLRTKNDAFFIGGK